MMTQKGVHHFTQDRHQPQHGVCDIYVTAGLLLQMNHSELELGEPISLSELHACQLTAPPYTLLLSASSSQSVNSHVSQPSSLTFLPSPSTFSKKPGISYLFSLVFCI